MYNLKAKNIIHILLFVFVTSLVIGCESKKVLVDKHFSIDTEGYFSNSSLKNRFRAEWREDSAPRVGLALAGGGTKAADFSLGVLQGLEESGAIGNIDIISSVSGGSYAALWYYSRILDGQIGVSKYNDCLSRRYSKYRSHQTELEIDKCVRDNFTNYLGENEDPDPYRYQNYLRGYQDILSNGKDLFGNSSFNYNSTNDNRKLSNDLWQLSFLSLGAAFLNIVPNILFDWEIPLSPTRNAYRTGIFRTFGANAPSCEGISHCQGCRSWRPEGSIKPVQEMSFENIKKLYQSGQSPMWVINTTAGESRTPWDGSLQQHPEFTVFEFTPFGSGSGIYGYRSKPLFDTVFPGDAVVSSAAFFDSQQKNVSKPPIRNLLSMLMKTSTVNWGRSYVNPNAEPLDVWLHHVIPWPFYYFHKFDSGADSVFIHLSDGGQSENLGVYSLVRRGVKNIIVSDHAYDRGGLMDDVCRLRAILLEKKLYLEFPGLKELGKVCNSGCKESSIGHRGYNIFDWQYPIVLGCISSDESNYECKKTGSEEYFSKIFLIKPSLANTHLKSIIKTVGASCKEDINSSQCRKMVSQHCEDISSFSGDDFTQTAVSVDGFRFDWEYDNSISCELLAFIMINSFSEDGVNDEDKCPHFPQHSTVTMTLNSSPWIYGASRELGRYYARQLGWFFGEKVSEVEADVRFRNELEKQAGEPISHFDVKPGLLFTPKAGRVGECIQLGL